jgi:uncharacterized damage-inducible protein DinB
MKTRIPRRRILETLAAGAASAAPVPAAGEWSNPFAKAFRDSFAEHWKDTKEYTLNILDAMPAEGFTAKPVPAQRTFGEQMVHLAMANVAYFRALELVPVPPALVFDRNAPEKTVDQKNKESVRRLVAAAFDYVASVLDRMTEKDLLRANIVFRAGMAPHSGIDVCMRAYMHTAHHRGQVVTYLRVQGITPPAWKFEPTAG